MFAFSHYQTTKNMKPTTLFFSLIGSITVGAMSALPSFTQVPTPTVTGAPVPSTNIPITGSVTANVDANGRSIIITGASVLSSIGTVRITGGGVFSATDSAGQNISSISVGLIDDLPNGTNLLHRIRMRAIDNMND